MPTPRQLLEFATMPSGMEQTALEGVVAENMDKDFVQRIVNQNPTVSNSSPNVDGTRSTHLMQSGGGYVFPSIIQRRGKFKKNTVDSGEDINMGNDAAAQWFANNYKRVNPAGFK